VSTGGAARAASSSGTAVREIVRRQMRVSLLLIAIMLVCYFTFALLMAFAKGFLAREIVDGLPLGIVLSFLLMVIPWVLAWIYVSWANRHHDKACDQLGHGGM